MAFPQNTASCIQHLYPNSKIDRDWVVVSRNSVIEIEFWNTDIGTKPTEDEINAVSKTVEDQWNAQEYARNRAPEYPSNGDQWDMIYKDTKNSTTTHADAVEAVKTKWPKDNSGPVE